MDDQQKKAPAINRDILQVEVRNPDTVLYSGPATAVSSKNSVGPFDVLPQHENFISLLSDKIIIYKDKHQKQEIPNNSAIIKAKQNRVNIFLGVEMLAAPGQQNPTPVSPPGAPQQVAPVAPTPPPAK